MALSRQGLPTWDSAAVPEDAVERGAYVLRDCDGEPEVILMASGSEVDVAHQAAGRLEEAGMRSRLVSMPCMDRFAAQDQGYRDSVLPPAIRARVAVEAAGGWVIRVTWWPWRASARRRRRRPSTSASASPGKRWQSGPGP